MTNSHRHYKMNFQNDSNVHINGYISQNDIFTCIKKLKNNKACGENEIINEFIKFTSNRFIHIYEKLFNIVFDTGIPSMLVKWNY